MKRVDGHRLLLLIFGILSIAVMAVIFLFSNQSGDESSALSESFIKQAKDTGLDAFTPKFKLGNNEEGKKDEEGPVFELNVRKWGHVYLYALLGLMTMLWSAELLRGKKLRLPAGALMAFVICMLYACTDEFHQTFIDSREGKPFDLIYDALGSGTSIILVLLLLLIFSRLIKTLRRKANDPH